MIRRRLASIVASASLALTGAAAVAPIASASTKPTASLTFSPNKVTAKAKLTVKYTSAHLPAGSSLYLQWQVGSAHVWKRYAILKGVSGTASEPGVAQGRYEFRIYVSTKTKEVTASVARYLYSYGNVPMLTICRTAAEYGYCQAQTEQVGSTVFNYIYGSGNLDEYPTFDSIFNYQSTTCRSASISFASNNPQNDDGNSYIRVQQASSAQQNAQTGPNTLSRFSATFDGGSWYLDVSSDEGYGVDVNGTFSCYTASGF